MKDLFQWAQGRRFFSWGSYRSTRMSSKPESICRVLCTCKNVHFQREIIHSFRRVCQGIHNAEKVKIHFSRLGMRPLEKQISEALRKQGAQDRRNPYSHLTYRTYTSMHLHTNVEMRTISWTNRFPSIKLF